MKYQDIDSLRIIQNIKIKQLFHTLSIFCILDKNRKLFYISLSPPIKISYSIYIKLPQ